MFSPFIFQVERRRTCRYMAGVARGTGGFSRARGRGCGRGRISLAQVLTGQACATLLQITLVYSNSHYLNHILFKLCDKNVNF